MRLRGNVSKRLAGVRDEIHRLRETARMLDEQVAYARELADDAGTRAVVSSTPLADKEHRGAADDLRRVTRERDEVRARIDALLVEQDALLDRMAQPIAETDR